MKEFTNEFWHFYFDEDKVDELIEEKVGKWMYFFSDYSFAKKICREVVDLGIVIESKHSESADGVCCFYLNEDDYKTHKKIIAYLLNNNLVRKTKKGKLYNISFKKDEQTLNNEYGDMYSSQIKLEQFVDLETGEWIFD